MPGVHSGGGLPPLLLDCPPVDPSKWPVDALLWTPRCHRASTQYWQWTGRVQKGSGADKVGSQDDQRGFVVSKLGEDGGNAQENLSRQFVYQPKTPSNRPQSLLQRCVSLVNGGLRKVGAKKKKRGGRKPVEDAMGY